MEKVIDELSYGVYAIYIYSWRIIKFILSISLFILSIPVLFTSYLIANLNRKIIPIIIIGLIIISILITIQKILT